MFLTRSFSSLPSLPFGVWSQGQSLGWMSALGSKSSPLTPQLTSAALPQQARRQVRCPPPLRYFPSGIVEIIPEGKHFELTLQGPLLLPHAGEPRTLFEPRCRTQQTHVPACPHEHRSVGGPGVWLGC